MPLFFPRSDISQSCAVEDQVACATSNAPVLESVMVSHALRKPSHIRISANICHLLLLQASNDGLFLGRGIEWISIAICES